MHGRTKLNFFLTDSNIVIYAIDINHEAYIDSKKKLFCLCDNDITKHDILSYDMDKMLARGEWFC